MKPSIPLPWTLRDSLRAENPYWHHTALYAGERLAAHLQCTNGPSMADGAQTARYVLHAVNAYPELVDALRAAIKDAWTGSAGASKARALLRKLEEIQ